MNRWSPHPGGLVVAALALAAVPVACFQRSRGSFLSGGNVQPWVMSHCFYWNLLPMCLSILPRSADSCQCHPVGRHSAPLASPALFFHYTGGPLAYRLRTDMAPSLSVTCLGGREPRQRLPALLCLSWVQSLYPMPAFGGVWVMSSVGRGRGSFIFLTVRRQLGPQWLLEWRLTPSRESSCKRHPSERVLECE